MAKSSSAYVDQIALETARAIMEIAARDCPGGEAQHQAAIQVAVIEAIQRCLPDRSNATDSAAEGFTAS